MLAASFLVKHLLIPWREGAAWFWDTLVDADLANNTMGWQWSAGCGADAAPYFRIFNPVTQGERFDPDGNYVRRWYRSWRPFRTSGYTGPGKRPGWCWEDVSTAIVEHAAARKRALAALGARSFAG